MEEKARSFRREVSFIPPKAPIRAEEMMIRGTKVEELEGRR